MNKLITSAVLAFALITHSPGSFADERTITLAVDSMVCAVCAHNVRKALQAVPGVAAVRVSLKEKTAVVVYDDRRADLNALLSATIRAGFRSAPKN